MRQNLIRGLGLSALIVVLDQASKWWITEVVMQPPESVVVLPFFNIVLAYNRGVSFGMFAAGSDAGKWMLVGLAALITLFLLHWLYKATNTLNVLALGLIIGGAVGNVIDRIAIGAVVDFLDFHAYGYHWPAFNVADISIFVGAGLLILESLFRRDEIS
jgi:signal peptidase II